MTMHYFVSVQDTLGDSTRCHKLMSSIITQIKFKHLFHQPLVCNFAPQQILKIIVFFNKTIYVIENFLVDLDLQ